MEKQQWPLNLLLVEQKRNWQQVGMPPIGLPDTMPAGAIFWAGAAAKSFGVLLAAQPVSTGGLGKVWGFPIEGKMQRTDCCHICHICGQSLLRRLLSDAHLYALIWYLTVKQWFSNCVPWQIHRDVPSGLFFLSLLGTTILDHEISHMIQDGSAW